MIRQFVKIAAIAILLTGCMNKGTPLPPGSAEEEVWQTFMASSGYPTRTQLSGSLRFGTADDTRRVTYSLWNSDSLTGKSVRLQVSAGVGSVIAEAMFNDSGMLIILPREGKAYVGKDSPENISRILGFSFPFKISRLKEYLDGDYFTALESPSPKGIDIAGDGNTIFHCSNPYGLMDITLARDARPSSLKHEDKWLLNVTYGDDALPKRLDGIIKGDDGDSRLILLVKDRRLLPRQMEASLTVPDGFTIYDIND